MPLCLDGGCVDLYALCHAVVWPKLRQQECWPSWYTRTIGREIAVDNGGHAQWVGCQDRMPTGLSGEPAAEQEVESRRQVTDELFASMSTWC